MRGGAQSPLACSAQQAGCCRSQQHVTLAFESLRIVVACIVCDALAVMLSRVSGKALVDEGRWQEAVVEFEKRLSLAQRMTKDKPVSVPRLTHLPIAWRGRSPHTIGD